MNLQLDGTQWEQLSAPLGISWLKLWELEWPVTSLTHLWRSMLAVFWDLVLWLEYLHTLSLWWEAAWLLHLVVTGFQWQTSLDGWAKLYHLYNSFRSHTGWLQEEGTQTPFLNAEVTMSHCKSNTWMVYIGIMSLENIIRHKDNNITHLLNN